MRWTQNSGVSNGCLMRGILSAIPRRCWVTRIYFSGAEQQGLRIRCENRRKVVGIQDKKLDGRARRLLLIIKFMSERSRSKIYLLNARTGELEARRERTVRIQGIEYGCANGVFRPVFPEHNAKVWRGYTAGSESYPVTANGIAYIGARDGRIHGFDLASKTETWVYQTDGFVDAAPAISDGVLYAASRRMDTSMRLQTQQRPR